MPDSFIFYQLHNVAFKLLWLDIVIIFFAVYVPFILIGVLFLFLIKDFKKHIRPVFGAILSACLGGGLVLAINLIFYRARPFVWTETSLLTKSITDSAFPSFHASSLFALSFFLFLYARKQLDSKTWKKVSYIFLVASLLVSLARVFSGLHWPADIAAGIILGFLVGFLVHALFKRRV